MCIYTCIYVCVNYFLYVVYYCQPGAAFGSWCFFEFWSPCNANQQVSERPVRAKQQKEQSACCFAFGAFFAVCAGAGGVFVLLLLVCVCAFCFCFCCVLFAAGAGGCVFCLCCCRGLLSKTKHPLTPTAKNKASPPAATIKKNQQSYSKIVPSSCIS